ncbi:unnamed protein product [Urochloa decumbens]|uniref:Uncharacterized protein n=1 Tax=Urochloa decumbens TaxID=240449 RepID=A0ABC9B8U8_9POAL
MDAVRGILSFGVSMGQAPTELQNELHQLETKLLTARVLISRCEWGMVKNKDLVEALLMKLKHTAYDAEDLLREFHDRALRQEIEDAGRSRTGQLISSSLSIAKHLVHASDKRIRTAQGKLNTVMAEAEEVLRLVGLDRVEPVQVMPTTTEIITASRVFGRDTERDQVMEILGVNLTIDRADEMNQVITQLGLGVPFTTGMSAGSSKGMSTEAAGHGGVATSTPNSAKRLKVNSSSFTGGDVSVLPIFGIGGMGKTTLAQLIYNDERVRAHFTATIWVCVSDLFDIERMTKEMVLTISEPNFDSSCNLGGLQAKLKEKLKSHKFLLVLDDIWQITKQQWEFFYAPLRHGLEGSMILVTTRHENIAHLVSTSNCKPVQLEGLPDDIFWEFFKRCAFDKVEPESYPHLQEIGRRIASRLCGTPLAAKTLGRLLNSNLTKQHWMNINNSELWEQEQKEGEILPALRLSYLYLPVELRRCFAFCSIFPKDYSFKRHEIVNIWVAEGFVAPLGSMHLEDVGIRYLDELRSRCLFQTDPKFPNKDRYVMHDLIHDTAQYVSIHECFSVKDLSGMTNKPRHMSVEVDGKSLSTMANIQNLNKLRSLRFGTKLDIQITWFSHLSNILFLSLEGCKLKCLPQSICELNSLRYLDISKSDIEQLPAKLWCLCSLQVVDASNSCLRTVHQDVTKLINLRQLALPAKASIALSKVHGLGKLSCLRNLSYFTVGSPKGAIGELKGMNQLRGTLCIKSVYMVKSKEEAAEARLVDKKFLEALDLNWERGTRNVERRPIENEVIEGLCPNERIECIKLHGFGGDRLPGWFNPKHLQNLRSLELSHCVYVETLSVPHFAGGAQGGCSNDIVSRAFTHLTCISLVRCSGLKNLDQFLSPKNLPSVESILLESCFNLESIPAHTFVGFVRLRDLRLSYCTSLVCPQAREMVLPPSLQRLCIESCGQLERSFPSCLEELTSLTVLDLTRCDNIESIPLDSIPCRNMLKLLSLNSCKKLSSIGGSGIPSSIEYVSIRDCPKLVNPCKTTI